MFVKGQQEANPVVVYSIELYKAVCVLVSLSRVLLLEVLRLVNGRTGRDLDEVGMSCWTRFSCGRTLSMSSEGEGGCRVRPGVLVRGVHH